jgi:hypothetical protein
MRFIPIALILLLSSMSFPTLKKGCGGKYYITGTAISSKLEVREAVLDVQHGDKKWQVSTDEHGKFEIIISWMSACPSGLTPAERDRMND